VHPAAYIARFQPCLWLLPPPLPVVSPSIHPIWPAVVETQRATDRPTDQKPTSNCCGILPFPLPSLTPLSYFLHNSIVRGCSSFSTPPPTCDTHLPYLGTGNSHYTAPALRRKPAPSDCDFRPCLLPTYSFGLPFAYLLCCVGARPCSTYLYALALAAESQASPVVPFNSASFSGVPWPPAPPAVRRPAATGPVGTGRVESGLWTSGQSHRQQ
jgi:hypothetical protein